MSAFSSEWITVRGIHHAHRVLLESRLSHPIDEHRFAAQVVARAMDANGSGLARVTRVFSDEKAGNTASVEVASTVPEDAQACITAESALAAISWWVPIVNFTLVERGSELSDSYDHMEHLSAACGLIKK